MYSAEEFLLVARKVLTERCSLEKDLYSLEKTLQ